MVVVSSKCFRIYGLPTFVEDKYILSTRQVYRYFNVYIHRYYVEILISVYMDNIPTQHYIVIFINTYF